MELIFMTETFKHKSRLITVLAAIIIGVLTYISTMQPEILAQYLPGYERYAPIIIVLAAIVLNALSEEKRVNVAEQLAIEHNAVVQGNPINEETVLNDEYETDEVEDGT